MQAIKETKLREISKLKNALDAIEALPAQHRIVMGVWRLKGFDYAMSIVIAWQDWEKIWLDIPTPACYNETGH